MFIYCLICFFLPQIQQSSFIYPFVIHLNRNQGEKLTSSFLSHSNAWSILPNPSLFPDGCLPSRTTPASSDGLAHLRGPDVFCLSVLPGVSETLWLWASISSSWALQSKEDGFLVSSFSFSVKAFKLERWSSCAAARLSGLFKGLSACDTAIGFRDISSTLAGKLKIIHWKSGKSWQTNITVGNCSRDLDGSSNCPEFKAKICTDFMEVKKCKYLLFQRTLITHTLVMIYY